MNKIELVEPSNSLEILIINGTNRGLKVVVHVLNKSGAGQTKWSIFMFIISGQGRKSGVARATEATASLVPLAIPNKFKISPPLLHCVDWEPTVPPNILEKYNAEHNTKLNAEHNTEHHDRNSFVYSSLTLQ